MCCGLGVFCVEGDWFDFGGFEFFGCGFEFVECGWVFGDVCLVE